MNVYEMNGKLYTDTETGYRPLTPYEMQWVIEGDFTITEVGSCD